MGNKFYDVPTQVSFLPSEADLIDTYDLLFGIAFGDIIICGCCGAVFEVNECDIFEDLPWVSVSDEIRGDYIRV